MDYFFLGYWIGSLFVSALLGLIPAAIAKKKGHSFGLWWFYGWMLFIVAIIHVQFISDENASPAFSAQSPAEELKKYKELYDQGVLTEEEFNEKKNQLLRLI